MQQRSGGMGHGHSPAGERSMKTYLRENLMIVVSIALPLMVALFFVLASILPGLYSSPPAHDLLITLQGRTTAYSSQVKIKLVIRNERLKAVVVLSDQSNFENNPRLFRYSHVTGDVREISIQLPEDITGLSYGDEIPVPELAGLRVSSALRAPDGYEFRGYRRGGGLMTDLFGGSRNRTDVSIAKNGAIVRLRLPESDYWYNDVRFVGWVIEQGD
jgi:hypothetical protein